MSSRARWWSLIVVAIIAIALRGPLHGGIGLRAYQSDRVEPGLVLVNTDMGLQGVIGAGTGIVLSPDGEVLKASAVRV